MPTGPIPSRHLTAACVAVAAIASLSGAAVAHGAPGVPAPAFTRPNASGSLLMPAPAVANLVRAPGLHATGVTAAMPDTSGRVDPPTCVVAFQPAEASAYPDVLLATTVTQDDAAKRRAPNVLVTQSILDFDDAASARHAFDAASAAWGRCGSQTVSIRSSRGAQTVWQMGPPGLRADARVLAATNTGPDVTCERALTTRHDVVVDVRVCQFASAPSATPPDPTGQAVAIAATVGEAADRRGPRG